MLVAVLGSVQAGASVTLELTRDGTPAPEGWRGGIQKEDRFFLHHQGEDETLSGAASLRA